MTLRLPLLALSILALALAGCGSSDKTTGDGASAAAPAPLTKTELVAKADAICKDMQAKIDKIQEPETIKELESAISEQIKLSGPAIEELESLTPPEDLAAEYKSWTAKLQELQQGTEKVREAAASGSQDQVQKVIAEVDSVNTKADEIGKKLGFKVCAK
ncbi:MAG: hypothetical protein JHC98_08925 [Thermoleophilaceae bacterium]|nr:hypothetical protein [Thermoleophilaceae bacterium]